MIAAWKNKDDSQPAGLTRSGAASADEGPTNWPQRRKFTYTPTLARAATTTVFLCNAELLGDLTQGGSASDGLAQGGSASDGLDQGTSALLGRGFLLMANSSADGFWPC